MNKLLLICATALMALVPAAFAQPIITSQPSSTSAAVGSTVGFSVSASGTGTITYQWRKNGTNLVNGAVSGAATNSGVTTTSLSLAGVTTNNQDLYSCRVTNATGSVTSSVVTLTVIVPPTITTQPKNYNTNTGASVTFSVVASGSTPLSYQWYYNSSPISGATLSTYSLSGLFTSDSGTYNVRVSNSAGNITSSNAVLNVGTAVAITSQPSSLTVTQGQTANFSVTANGTSLNYFWKKNAALIPGQTNAALAFTNTVATNAATYTCQVSNFLGAVTSSNAILTVYYPPVITVQPSSQTIGVGSNFTVSVTASGVPAVGYQWRTNGTVIPGATGSSYTVTGAQSYHFGSYDVVITNLLGSVTSSVANISIVYYPPTISLQPVGGNYPVGSNFTLNSDATGTAPLYWQWRTNGTDIPGANTNTYTINPAQVANSGAYTVVVTNSTGSATSSVAVVNVGYAPVVVQPPMSLTNSVGGTVTFSCVLTGTALISLQWTRNGIPLPGATNTTLTLTNLQPASIGYYSLTATNLFGGTVSSNASLNLAGYDFGVWNGLVAYYPFNGNANDESGRGNAAGVNGPTVTNDRFGSASSAYKFTTLGDKITTASAIGFPISTDDFTLSLWVNVTSNSGTHQIFVCNGALEQFQLHIGAPASDASQIGFQTGGTGACATPLIPWFLDHWYNLWVVRSQNVVSIYRGGVLLAQNTTTLGNQATSNQQNLLLGYRPSPENQFYGTLDDVRIYNRALSSNELASLYAMEADMPVITQQPQVQTASVGGTVTFTVTATANHPLSYQWFKDGIALNSATNTSLTLSNVQPNQIGYYSVTISNAVVGVTSSNAALNLNGYSFSQWQGLVAYYPFNGNANDASGNGNNGSSSGGVSLTSNRFALAGSAMSFNGVDGRITVNPNPTLSFPAEQYSFSCWVLFNQTTRTAFGYDWQSLFLKNNFDNMGLMLATAGDNLLRAYSGPSQFTTYSWPNVISNKWFNVVLVRGSNTTLFVDGKPLGTFANVGSVASNTNALNLGYNSQGGYPYPLDGIFDDIRIYNRALSSNEVASLYAVEADVPVITQQPLPQTVNVGGAITFSVTATATNPLSYQWFKDGVVLVGATNTVLRLTNVQPNQIGYYSVTISNAVAGVTSTNAALNLNGYSFSQWQGLVAYYQFNGNANDESVNANNAFNSGAVLNKDRFGITNKCYLFNGLNSRITAVDQSYLKLNNTDFAITIWAQELNNQTYSFILAKDTGGGQNFKWTVILGAYHSAPTSSLTLTFYDPNMAVHWLGAAPITSDSNWHLYSITRSGNLFAFYQDGKLLETVVDSGALPSINDAPLTIGNAEGGGWHNGNLDDIRIYNRALSSNEVASLYAMEADVPVITQQPQPQTVNAGGAVTFSVTATATNPLSYQWRKNSSPIPGATNAIFALTNAQSAAVGFYSVTVSNAVSGVVSASALLNLTGYADPTWKGLVAYYPFNGNASDASGNGNDGSNNGATTGDDRFGMPTSAYVFSGAQFIDCGTNIVIGKPNDRLTVSVWFKTTTAHIMVSDYDSSGGDSTFAVHVVSGNQIQTDSRSSGVDYLSSSITTGLASGFWHQAVYQMDGTNLALYVDGRFDHATPYNASLNYYESPHWRIGANRFLGNISSALIGSLDDVRIYNRALSADEVAYLYTLESQSTLQPPQTLSASAGAGRCLNLNLTGLPGRNYILQSATNLLPPVQWLPLLTNAADTNGVWQFTDTNLNSSQKFYRSVGQ